MYFSSLTSTVHTYNNIQEIHTPLLWAYIPTEFEDKWRCKHKTIDIVTWMHSFPLIVLWFIYLSENVCKQQLLELFNNTPRYVILNTLNLGYSLINLREPYNMQRPNQRRIQDFKLGGVLKQIAPSGGRCEQFWGILCEKSRFYAKKSYLFPISGGRRPPPPPPPPPPPLDPPLLTRCDIAWLHVTNNLFHGFPS
jgi:hypothetical protein